MLIVYAAVPGDRAAAGVRAGDGRRRRTRCSCSACAMTLLAVGYLGVQYMLALGPRRVPARAGRGRGGRDRRCSATIGIEVAARRSPRVVLALQAAAALSVLAIGLARPGPAPRRGARRRCARDRGLADRGAGRAAVGRAARARARRARSSRSAPSAGARRSCSRCAAGSVVAIDPHAGSDRGPQEIAAEASRGDADHDAFLGQPGRARACADRVRHVRKFSDDALGDVDRAALAAVRRRRAPLRPGAGGPGGWGARVAPGGTMLVHDAFSSIGVTLGAARRVRVVARVALRRADRLPGRVRAPWRCRARAGPGAPRRRAAVVRAQRGDQGAGRWRGGGAGRSGSGSIPPRPGPTELAREREDQQRDAGHRDPVDGDPVDRVLGVVAAAVLRPDQDREDRHRDRRAPRRPRARAGARRCRATGRRTSPSANSGVAAGGEHEPEREPADHGDRAPRGAPTTARRAPRPRARIAAPPRPRPARLAARRRGPPARLAARRRGLAPQARAPPRPHERGHQDQHGHQRHHVPGAGPGGSGRTRSPPSLQLAGHAPGRAERRADLRLPEVVAVAGRAAAAVVALGEDEAGGRVECESHARARAVASRGPGVDDAAGSRGAARARGRSAGAAGTARGRPRAAREPGLAGRQLHAARSRRRGAGGRRRGPRSCLSAREAQVAPATVPSSTQSRLRAPRARDARARSRSPRISAIPTARRCRAGRRVPAQAARRISSRNRPAVTGAREPDTSPRTDVGGVGDAVGDAAGRGSGDARPSTGSSVSAAIVCSGAVPLDPGRAAVQPRADPGRGPCRRTRSTRGSPARPSKRPERREARRRRPARRARRPARRRRRSPSRRPCPRPRRGRREDARRCRSRRRARSRTSAAPRPSRACGCAGTGRRRSCAGRGTSARRPVRARQRRSASTGGRSASRGMHARDPELADPAGGPPSRPRACARRRAAPCSVVDVLADPSREPVPARARPRYRAALRPRPPATVARRSLYGQQVDVVDVARRVEASPTARAGPAVSARSACQCVASSPSSAANGRCSGNCGNPGEDGARHARDPVVDRDGLRVAPRAANGLSTAASTDGSSAADSTGPAFCASREGTSTRRRLESVITTSSARRAVRRRRDRGGERRMRQRRASASAARVPARRWRRRAALERGERGEALGGAVDDHRGSLRLDADQARAPTGGPRRGPAGSARGSPERARGARAVSRRAERGGRARPVGRARRPPRPAGAAPLRVRSSSAPATTARAPIRSSNGSQLARERAPLLDERVESSTAGRWRADRRSRRRCGSRRACRPASGRIGSIVPPQS